MTAPASLLSAGPLCFGATLALAQPKVTSHFLMLDKPAEFKAAVVAFREKNQL